MELQERVGREGGGGGRGEALASFLPGVTIAITKLLTSDPNLGQVCLPLPFQSPSSFLSPSLPLSLSPVQGVVNVSGAQSS